MRRLTVAALVLAALCVPAVASARTFSGTISVTSVPASPSGDPITVGAIATVTQVCNGTFGSPGYEYCGYFPTVTTVRGDQPCSDAITGSSWIGLTSGAAAGPQSLGPYWHEWPRLESGPKRACLYVNSGGVTTLVAETTYDVPTPPAATTAPVATAPSAPPPAVDYDCGDFRYQQDAQAFLLLGDPYRLDADHDGVACEELPRRSTSGASGPAYTRPSVFLDYDEAVQVARRALSRRYGRTWKSGRERRVTCPVRTGDETMGCRAAWVYRYVRYRATIVVQEYATSYGWTTKIVSRRRA